MQPDSFPLRVGGPGPSPGPSAASAAPAVSLPTVSSRVRRPVTPPNELKRRAPSSPSSPSPSPSAACAPPPKRTAFNPPTSVLPPSQQQQQQQQFQVCAQPTTTANSQPQQQQQQQQQQQLTAQPLAAMEAPAPAPAPATATAPKPAARGWDAASEGSQFSAYMSAKNNKLRAQFDAERAAAAAAAAAAANGITSATNITITTTTTTTTEATTAPAPGSASATLPLSSTSLAGVTVWVDGFTTPSRTELRALLMAHGGYFETYLTDRVTHIVADNLAAATRRRLAALMRPPRSVRVVRAAWVAASVAAGRRAPEREFAVPGMNDPAQKTIGKFFAPAKKNSSVGAFPKR